ncbi:MAG: pyridoxal phosphate-dependent aminotransferase family protein [bacterium]|nr:pyridoxal phosphate-dependent aminotransferase family protein [bacterium]
MESTPESAQRALEAPFLMESPPGTETVINGRRYLYFGGVSYFGLHADEALMEEGIRAWRELGLGSATSRAGMGTTRLHLEVERAAAEFFATDAAAYLPSGYLSNMAGVQALYETAAFDAVFVDEHSHFCVHDAAMVTGVPVYSFAHTDPDDLNRQLAEHLEPAQKPLLMTDGLFPTFGRIAPLPDYVEVLEPYAGTLWIDEAHPVGILGPNGRGTYDHFDLSGERLLFGGTLSKAFGGFGGVIPGSADFIARVLAGPVLIAASPPPSPVAAATLAGIERVAANPQWKERLWANARRLKEGIRGLGFEVEHTHVPIAAVALGSADRMQQVHRRLLERGIAIQYIHYPGAGADGVLRMVVFSTHTPEQIARLIEELGRLV